jgi:hypothetical protein
MIEKSSYMLMQDFYEFYVNRKVESRERASAKGIAEAASMICE